MIQRGVGTLGLITHYWYGYDIGFSKEVSENMSDAYWDVEEKMQWYRDESRKTGGDIWFDSIGWGAFVDGDTVKGAVVATPFGRGVVLADTVIDSTGNAVIAVAAGAPCIAAATMRASAGPLSNCTPVIFEGCTACTQERYWTRNPNHKFLFLQ